MLSRLPTRAALAVVALAVIALLLNVALLGRLGLLTDPMVDFPPEAGHLG
jgi:hypothetical protein